MRMNARRMDSGVPSPQAREICCMHSPVSSSMRRAASMRAASTNLAGVTPTSRANARAKVRGLIDTRRDMAGTERSASG